MANTTAEVGGLVSGLGALLESGAGADVTLVVGESELPAHSFVLALRSPVFAASLKHDMQESRTRRIEIADVQEAVLRQLLCFMYTDWAPELDSMAAELLSAADKYDVPLLKKRCEQAMARQLTVENAAATAVFAELHSCPLLKSAAVDFIAGHPQVMATEGWINDTLSNAKAAAEICKQLAVAKPSSQNRIVSKETKQMMTAELIHAASKGRAREVWALLAAGADKDARDSSGNSVLHLAAKNGNAKTVRCLLDGGLDVNAANSSGQTPLHVATERGDTDIMWTLLAASARVDAQDNQGQTALHVAAQKHSIIMRNIVCPDPTPILQVLLLAGASKDVKNFSGETPENVASSSMKYAFDDYNNL